MGCCILGALAISQLLVIWQAIKHRRIWVMVGGASIAISAAAAAGFLLLGSSADVPAAGKLHMARCGSPRQAASISATRSSSSGQAGQERVAALSKPVGAATNFDD